MHSACTCPACLQAGVQLKKVQPAEDKAAQRPAAEAAGGGMFVPNPADLLKLRAGLRKTAPAAEEEQEEEAIVAPVAAAEPAQAATNPAAAMAAPRPGEAEQEAAAEPSADAAEPEAAAAVEPEAVVEDAAMPDASEAPEDAAAEPAAAPEEAAGAGEDAAPPAAADVPLLPGSALRKRKSVRFHVDPEEQRRLAGTPEGAARDATITIRLRKGDIEQVGRLGLAGWPVTVDGWLAGLLIRHHSSTACRLCLLASSACPPASHACLICPFSWLLPLPRLPSCLPPSPACLQIINVDDSTVAFAQWGLGTMGPGGLGSLEELEELPDTVVSKKSRHSCTAGFPPSAGKTPGALGARPWGAGRWVVAAGRWEGSGTPLLSVLCMAFAACCWAAAGLFLEMARQSLHHACPAGWLTRLHPCLPLPHTILCSPLCPA